MQTEKLTFLGAGAVARDLFWSMKDGFPDKDLDIEFVDEVNGISTIHLGDRTYPVLNEWSQIDEKRPFLAAVGDPRLKKRIVQEALNRGAKPAPTFIHPSCILLNCSIGMGGIIFPHCTFTSDAAIHDFVVVHMGSTVGHDSVLEDFVSVYPGSHISGNIHIGEGTLIGAGTVIKERLKVAKWVTVGAQSCVVQDIETGHSVYFGVPARFQRLHEETTELPSMEDNSKCFRAPL